MVRPPFKIAIIGGGVSGLSMAYYLQKHWPAERGELVITLFERKRQLGGNAETVLVSLGKLKSRAGHSEDYVRWADLGVNDVNLSAYPRLRAVMEDIGYLHQLKPLQNTESYFSQDGRRVLTDDRDLCAGVSDPAYSLAEVDGGRLAALQAVVHRAALDLIDDERITPRYTVADFFEHCLSEPRRNLSRAAEEEGVNIDWEDAELPARLLRVRDEIYYPRISAMYFADDRGPGVMPLQAPFEYYRVQEGGASAPERRYFDKGAQYWLEVLAGFVTAGARPGPRVEILRDTPVEVHAMAGAVRVRERRDWRSGEEASAGQEWTFDLAVMATHADDTQGLISFADAFDDVERHLRGLLGRVRYTKSFAVCHTAAHCLPPNRNAWRTYNIPIRSPQDSLSPYRIDYVVNRHQNDMLNPLYNHAGLPQYFVSLVDDLNRIPFDDMLDRCSSGILEGLQHFPADGMPEALKPQLDGAAGLSGYQHQLGIDLAHHDLGRKAWTYFKHNVLDAQCMDAQQQMAQYNTDLLEAWRGQQAPRAADLGPRLLFAGG